jgi:hypothetical protein
MDSFIWFLGRFHVLVLHLPLGILTLAAVLEVLVRFGRFASLRPALAPLWVAGALSAVATVVLGYLHASEDAFQGLAAVEAHRRAGVWLSVAACVGAALRTGLPGLHERIWFLPVAAVVALMVVTGHLGGNLTHGDQYLVQYAPGPLRALAGLPAVATVRPRPADLASADIFLDIVQPALERRCASCHNDSKRSGGLSVVSHARLMEGGKNGPVITPGDPAGSDLFHRVNLDPSSEEFMPKEGKTPLNGDEVAALGWWIGQGAPATGAVGPMEPPAAVASAINSMLGLAGAAGAVAAGAGPGVEGPLPEVAPAEEAAVAKLVAEGFIVRKVAQDSNLLDVDYASPKPLSPESLQHLARLAPNVLRLNLRDAGLTDESLKVLGTFTHLRQLRLEKNDISDAGASALAALASLTSLNLTGTKITDAGFAELARLENLQVLYVWGTPVTPGAVERVGTERKDLRVVAGLRSGDVPRPEKVVPPDA